MTAENGRTVPINRTRAEDSLSDRAPGDGRPVTVADGSATEPIDRTRAGDSLSDQVRGWAAGDSRKRPNSAYEQGPSRGLTRLPGPRGWTSGDIRAAARRKRRTTWTRRVPWVSETPGPRETGDRRQPDTAEPRSPNHSRSPEVRLNDGARRIVGRRHPKLATPLSPAERSPKPSGIRRTSANRPATGSGRLPLLS